MFNREITMSIPEFLQQMEDERNKKIQKQLNKSQMQKLATISLAFLLNPKPILALSSIDAQLSMIRLVCLGVIIALPTIAILISMVKEYKNGQVDCSDYENENTIVDYTETKIDRNWDKGGN